MDYSNGWICGPRTYFFRGIAFEVSPTIGPWPIKKNGDPKKLAGRRFYDFYKRFEALPKETREKYRTGGGCTRF